jgi:hypothetical protein
MTIKTVLGAAAFITSVLVLGLVLFQTYPV